jgi:four helix bundle protein
MTFDAYNRSLDLLHTLVPLLKRLSGADPKLADQLRRAAQSIVLNIAEANRRSGDDRKYRFRIALGSAAEVGACLEVATAFGYAQGLALEQPATLADRVRAMTYRLATAKSR